MASTYEKIATTTLSSATSSISFTSIPSTYTDLRVVFTLIIKAGGTIYALCDLNGDTATNYSETWVDGYAGAAQSGRDSNDNFFYLSQRPFYDTNLAFVTLDFMSYAGSTYKSCLISYDQEYNGSGFVGKQVGLWRSTSAINTIHLYSNASVAFVAGTTATIYGIKAA